MNQLLRRLGELPAHWISLLVLAIYLVTYAGVLHSVDEVSGLTVTESLLVEGRWHTNAMAWDQNRTPPQNALGVDGNLYSKKGLGISLAAWPLLALGRLWVGVGAVQVALLTNLFLTALTVYLFYHVVIALNFPPPTAVLGAVALGLATPLWPYARTLFSESIAAFGLSLALLGTFHYRAALRTHEPIRPLLAVSAGLAVLVLARSTNAILAAPIMFYLAYIRWQARSHVGPWPSLGALAALALPLGGAIMLTVLYNYVRFHTWLTFPLEPFETFSTPLLTGLSGLLISPGKGLIWYMPVILLGCFGLREWRQRGQTAEFLVATVIFLLTLLFYAKWYDWTGGRAWGPRMIVIAAPALIMLCLPLLDRLRQPHGMVRWWIGGILLLSICVQLPGAWLNFELLEAEQMKRGLTFEQLVWSLPHTPLLTAWPSLFTGTLVDPVWWRASFWQQSTMDLGRGLASGLFFIAVMVWGIRRALQGKSTGVWGWVSLGLAVLFALSLAQLAGTDPRWQERTATPEDSRAVVEFIGSQTQTGDVVLLDMRATTDQFGWQSAWMNRGVHTVPYLTWVRDSAKLALSPTLANWIDPYARVWLVMQETAEGAPDAYTEAWLNQTAYRGRQQWIGAQRVVEYFMPTANTPLASEDVTLTFAQAATLESYAVHGGGRPDYLLVDLTWESAPADHWRFSVQTLDRQGQLVAQSDGRPASLPQLRNRVGLTLPTAAHQLILKIYDSQSGQVATVESGGQRAEFITLATWP